MATARGDAATERTGPVGGDSILPMDIMIERFQAGLPRVTSLDARAPRSRDELVARFAEAVQQNSVGALQTITLNAAEFAHIYFPTSIYAGGPYAQPPAVNWLLLEQNSLKGRTRLLRHYGGRRMVIEGHRCVDDPLVEGRNRIHERCILQVRVNGARLEDARLFGSIIERDGRFKLMSLANHL